MKKKALEFATKAHSGQKRKYVDEDYIYHPIRVAAMLEWIAEESNDPRLNEDVVAAALLHDTVEDCDTTTEDIKNEFNERVQKIVADLTKEELSFGNRATRKIADKARLAAACYEAKTLKCIDVGDNLPSIVLHDPGFAPKWVGEAIDLFPHIKDGNKMAAELLLKVINDHVETNPILAGLPKVAI